MTEGRSRRVGEQVRKEVAELLLNGVKDPRVGFVSVMEVRMSPDLGYADVFVSVYGSERERANSLIGLKRSAGWLRRELGKRLRLRVTPELRFKEDSTLDTVYRIEERIREIHAEDEHDDTKPDGT